MKRFRLSVGMFLVLLASSVAVLGFAGRQHASADSFNNMNINARFIDAAHILVNVTSGTYTDDAGDPPVDITGALSGMYYTGSIWDSTAGLNRGFLYFQGGDKKIGVTGGCQGAIFFRTIPTAPGQYVPDTWAAGIPPKGTSGSTCINKNLSGPSYVIHNDVMGGPTGTASTTRYYVSDLTHINEVDNDPTYDSHTDNIFVLNKIDNGTTSITNGDKFGYLNDPGDGMAGIGGNHPNYGGTCPNQVVITGGPSGTGYYSGNLLDLDNANPGCKLNNGNGSPVPQLILDNLPSENAAGNLNPPTTGGAAGGTTGNPNGAITDSCPVTSPWQLNWIICPIINSVNGFVSTLSSEIQSSLLIDVDGWFNPSTDTAHPNNATAIRAAFNSFRVLGLSVLIAVAVAMVASQASGFEALDALTVRRFMPQFVASVILISILFPLEKVAVQIVNELSLWIPDALYSPFLKINPNIQTIDGWGLIDALIGITALVGILGPFAFFSFLLTAFFALLIAAITITLVKMAILGGLIVLPLAVAFRPIPNLRFIWDFILRLLQGGAIFIILVPIVYALGKIFAVLMPAGGMLIGHHGFFGNSATILFAATSGLLHSAAVGAAVIGPNFAVPKIAQIPGGAIATLAGSANNPSRGAFDRLKKYRGNSMKQRGQSWKAGSLYQDKGIRGRINNIGRRASVGPKGFSPFHKGQAANLMALQQSVDAQAAANDPRMKEFANFDDGNAVLGLSGGTVEGAERAAKVLFTKDGVYDAVRAQAALDGAKGMGINRANAGGAFKTMAQNKSRAVGAGRNDIIEMGAAALAGGNQSMYQSMMFDAAYNSRNAGRNDLGGTANTVTDEAVQKLMTDSGGSINAHDARKYLTTMDGMARTTVPQMMNGHTNQAIADTETIKKMVRSGGKSKQKTIALQRANEIAKNLSQANGDSQDTFNQFFKDLGVDTSSTVSFSRQLAASSLKHNMVDIENRMVEDPRYPNSGRKVYAAADQAAVADIDKLANEIEAGSRTYGNENAYRQQNQYELAA